MESLTTLVEWPQPVFELLGFIAAFFSIGPVGFRYGVLRSRASEDAELHRQALRRAAWIGVIGSALTALLLVHDLPEMAGDRHTTVAAILGGNRQVQIQIAMLALSLLGFLLAWGQVGAGWLLAALGVVVGMLRGVFTGRWLGLVNPIHELAAGAWIGTLFVMLTAGLSTILSAATPPERRGAAAGRMVSAFSAFALGSAAVLVVFGVITAWRHLKYWAALWTTPYGLTLIVKLILVLGVVALGAWNWRRQRPRMGTEEGARAITRSARAELTIAGLVLLVTAALVSMPAPKKPGQSHDESRAPAKPPAVAAAPHRAAGPLSR